MTPHQKRMILQGTLTQGVLGRRRFSAQVSLRAGETAGQVRLYLPYGMSANPVPSASADMLVLEIAGSSDNLAGFLDDWGLRIQGLAQGEYGWQDRNGQQIIFREGGIVITASLGLTINGNVTVNGTLTATTDVVGGGKSLKSHIHGGVTPGGGNTGAPV
jgi:phage gp45-like